MHLELKTPKHSEVLNMKRNIKNKKKLKMNIELRIKNTKTFKSFNFKYEADILRIKRSKLKINTALRIKNTKTFINFSFDKKL